VNSFNLGVVAKVVT